MRTIYFDCSMGAAGDMLSSALIELIPNKEEFIKKINSVGIPGVAVTLNSSTKCGITGTHLTVHVHGEEEGEHIHNHHHEHHHEHHHSSFESIAHLVSHLDISEKVKNDIIQVYTLIAQAESNAHGVPVEEIHFHEVGTMDAVADITMFCLLMEMIKAERVVASPVNVGSGQVKCAHGILPVPAPATAYILKDCPIYSATVKSELCTPTGAALLKYFADEFTEMPVMKIQSIGYGMGNKDFEAANCVRAFLGETESCSGTITELQCNVDDITAEEVAFATGQLFENGALDVYTVSVGMKKSRPGTLICVLCNNQDKEKMISLIFKYTTTLGIREQVYRRYTLQRCVNEISTEYGTVREKSASGYGIERSKYEFDDLNKIAKENGLSLNEVRKAADIAKNK